jgi:PAS domain S-box-containing protein
MIWVSAVNKDCVWFNRPWLNFTGRTMLQELGAGWAEGVHPDDYERCLEIYVDHFDARKEFRMQYRLLCHDGVYRWIDDRGAPRYARDGTFLGYIGSCVDVTPLKNLERRRPNLPNG